MAANKTFESSLKELEKAVDRLEAGELPLEEALACFEEGVRAAGDCQKMLQDAEVKISKLVSGKDGAPLFEPFTDGDSES